MRPFFALLLFAAFLQAQTLKIDRFESDLFSQKSKELQKIRLSLVLEGRDLEGVIKYSMRSMSLSAVSISKPFLPPKERSASKRY
ncbi:MAG: hypothetical protein B6D59_05925 [Campylobacteraceae bacterium 4484_4]|nr:MAG: hypothetical protein B6D59_05925 [Campylobacteraceae bacterium 4484_4]